MPNLFIRLATFSLACASLFSNQLVADERPNILWIYVDDMSDWLGCYGDSIAETPHIDSLASQGVVFRRAYVPAPVCSTTRSALITGTMQTSHGLHNHRTMIKLPLPEQLTTVPELFRAAGYVTFNEAKDDYNFQRDRTQMYSAEFKRPTRKQVTSHLIGHDLSWLKQLKGKPFFGQIQLKGGKLGGETGAEYPAPSRGRGDDVIVPPQYPDNSVFRNAIARHYEQIAETDAQVGAIISALREFELLHNTAIFFFTDHGSPLPRSKQFLYEEGTRVPLVVQWLAGTERIRKRGQDRSDVVSGIDITATSLGLAGLEIPSFMEGRNFFDADLARLIDAFLKQVIIHHGARMQVFWVGAELAGEIAEADRLDEKPGIGWWNETTPQKAVFVQVVERIRVASHSPKSGFKPARHVALPP